MSQTETKANSDYYSVKEAAHILGINTSLLMRKIRGGEIKAQKIGWVWVIPKEPIDRMARENQKSGKRK